MAIDRIVGELAGRQHTMVARWQLIPLGVSDEAIQHRCDAGRWRRRKPGVYQVGTGRPTRRALWMADVLSAGPESFLGGDCAAMIWSVHPATNRKTTVLTGRRGRRKRRDIDLRTTRHLPPEQTTTRDGIPVTTLARTIVDCAATFDDEQLEAALERAVVEHRLDLDAIRKRNRRLDQLIDDLQLGANMTRSELENRFRRIIRDLPQPRVNQDVWTGTRFYQPDFVWLEHRLIAEIDGWAVHRARTEADRRREAHLSALGFTIQRFTRLQLVRHQHEVRAALLPFLRQF